MAKAGDIALFRGKEDILDEGIELVTSSKYVHAGFFISENIIVEAWFPNVRYRDLTGTTGYDVYKFHPLLTQEQINNGVKYAKSKVEIKTKYNVLALLGILIEKIFHTKQNLFYSNRMEICSELVSEIFSMAMGIDLCLGIDDSITTPADLSHDARLVKIASY